MALPQFSYLCHFNVQLSGSRLPIIHSGSHFVSEYVHINSKILEKFTPVLVFGFSKKNDVEWYSLYTLSLVARNMKRNFISYCYILVLWFAIAMILGISFTTFYMHTYNFKWLKILPAVLSVLPRLNFQYGVLLSLHRYLYSKHSSDLMVRYLFCHL